MTANKSIAFFDEQFRRQAKEGACALNPFEERALPFLHGGVLDFGCGLGNLAFAAAGQGCRVTALDASPAAIEHVRARAAAEQAPVTAALADLRDYRIEGEYDAIACIGLLMFFDCATASRVLADLQARVRRGGVLVINVLVEGTTFMDMFDPSGYCLFSPAELESRFAGWKIEVSEESEFPAPRDTRKRFVTLIARKAAKA